MSLWKKWNAVCIHCSHTVKDHAFYEGRLCLIINCLCKGFEESSEPGEQEHREHDEIPQKPKVNSTPRKLRPRY